ncbi:putative RNA pseudouridylate synthase [Trypanosoma vivax]|uniref:Putative conserved RNA pseudouridylate synthase-like n=1 Tax=Trypanosoma vivax (strain Y486) TaxID=1055687 RepID=G0TWZ3_TRYVY|nr:putative RNA pseudouridylate synthase [Trypanosoma vivax]CCC48482.1 putative conserved RNA pseudouridylate synthase-like [Trypanosoma vivax Y486]
MGRSIRYSRPKTTAPQTLVDFLCARFPYLARDAWQHHGLRGHLSVTRKSFVNTVLDPVSYFLEQNDEIHFNPPRELEPAVDEHIAILHEDESIIVCVKNGNLPVAEGGRYSLNTLAGLLQRRCSEPPFQDAHAEGTSTAAPTSKAFHPVHRLDKETSGLVVLAKDPEAARCLSRQFEQQSEVLSSRLSSCLETSVESGQCKSLSLSDFDEIVSANKMIKKSYIAVLTGIAKENVTFVVCDYVGLLYEKLHLSGMDTSKHVKLKRLKMTCFSSAEFNSTHHSARPACSRVSILGSSESLGLSVARVDIITGRTHQIRLHCAQLGYPVLGDKLYMTTTPGLYGGCCAVPDDAYLERVRSVDGLLWEQAQLRVRRQLLHSFMLSFDHPVSSERMDFLANPRDWFLRDVAQLRTPTLSSTAGRQIAGGEVGRTESLGELLERALKRLSTS